MGEIDIWVDGGLVGPNPSPIGGTYAWVHVLNGQRIHFGSGFFEPKALGIPRVSNNISEMIAIIKGIESAPPRWRGLLWTDSKVTYLRITGSSKFTGVPKFLRLQFLAAIRGRMWTPMHCGGHPDKEDLEVGYDKRGLPVSKWNVFCDRRCKIAAQRYLEKTKDG